MVNAKRTSVETTAARKSVATGLTVPTPTAPGASYVQAEATSAKTSIDAIRAALLKAGITV